MSETSLNPDWRALIAPFQKPRRGSAVWQIVNSVGLYAALWFLLTWLSTISWALTIPLAVVMGGVMIRVFIIFHDCGHGSFFKSKRANDFWGIITGVLTFTPYHHWRWEHAMHHATSGNLDRRGLGDVWTLTVREYLALPRWQKRAYRILRHPLVLFGIAPLIVFVIRERFPNRKCSRRVRISVLIMNAVIVGWCALLIWIVGFGPWLIIQGTALATAATIGVWLFYVQHHYEDAYWEWGATWKASDSAIRGSSYYKLPRVLQWFTGNIGFHHIHHLSPRVPNYNLERCHRSHPAFQDVTTLTLSQAWRTVQCRLWDEDRGKMINFNQLRDQLESAR